MYRFTQPLYCAFSGNSFLSCMSLLASQVRSQSPGWSCLSVDVLLKGVRSLKVKCSLSSQCSRSLQRVLILPTNLAEPPLASSQSNSKPCSRMKMRLASKFSPRSVAETALMRFSLTRMLGSFFNSSIISSAPVLMDSFCTCASFWLAEAQICRAVQREVGSWEQKMILRSVMCPPSLYRVEPLSSESSNSCSSSKSPRTSSASLQRKLSRADRICWMRLISELVYCCMASSSHFLSQALISLNSDFLVPSVYFNENFSRPYQSIMVFYLYQGIIEIYTISFFVSVLEQQEKRVWVWMKILIRQRMLG